MPPVLSDQPCSLAATYRAHQGIDPRPKKATCRMGWLDVKRSHFEWGQTNSTLLLVSRSGWSRCSGCILRDTERCSPLTCCTELTREQWATTLLLPEEATCPLLPSILAGNSCHHRWSGDAISLESVLWISKWQCWWVFFLCKKWVKRWGLTLRL